MALPAAPSFHRVFPPPRFDFKRWWARRAGPLNAIASDWFRRPLPVAAAPQGGNEMSSRASRPGSAAYQPSSWALAPARSAVDLAGSIPIPALTLSEPGAKLTVPAPLPGPSIQDVLAANQTGKVKLAPPCLSRCRAVLSPSLPACTAIASAEVGAAQIINGSFITLNSIGTTAAEYMKEKRDDWRITPFQALNFEVAAIPQGLTEENLVGSGGSGHVYRVTYTNRYNSSTGVVAVKQIRSFGSLDEKLEREFESEARILCNIRHNNIVKLLCCLSSAESKLLVYDYMDNGSLDRWLHGDYILRAGNSLAMARPVQRVPLDWPTRLLVAVGAAQGLCYMHHECSPPIVHRDIKTSNILLDSEFRAKIADFGVARMLVRAGEPNTMSAVAGSFGYMAPEYAYTRKVNDKVDVYSFGVVLLELTTGKKANDGSELGCLAEWARHHYQSGASILDVIDKSIRYAGYPNEIETAFRLGVQCTGILPSPRPTMKDVLQILLKCSERTLRKSRMECSMEYEAAPFLLP